MMPTITSFLPTLPILPCDLETLGHLQQNRELHCSSDSFSLCRFATFKITPFTFLHLKIWKLIQIPIAVTAGGLLYRGWNTV